MGHVFISYKSKDPDAGADFIGSLKGEVRRAGFEPWAFEGDLIAGDEWRPEIDHAIKTAAALVVVMTPAAKASEYVTYEWSVAWGAGVPVIPLLLARTPMHPRLEAIQHEDFKDGKRPWDAFAKALRKRATEPRQAAARELAALQSELRAAVEKRDALIVGPSAKHQIPPAAKGAAEVLARYPTKVWQEAFSVGAKLYDRLAEFQRACSEFATAAERLDATLRRVIRLYNASKDTIAINDPADLSFFLGRIHGATPDDLLPWIDLPRSALSRFEASYAAACADAEVMALVPPYLNARKCLAAATEGLKKALC